MVRMSNGKNMERIKDTVTKKSMSECKSLLLLHKPVPAGDESGTLIFLGIYLLSVRYLLVIRRNSAT